MLDNENEEVIETKDEIVEEKQEETLEVNTDDVPNSSGKVEEDGGGIVKSFMTKLGIGGQKDKDEENEGTAIPNEFTTAATQAGWTEEEIVAFAADYNDVQLKEMIPFLLEEEKESEPEVKPVDKEKETPSTDKATLPKETVDAIKEELRKEFEAELKSLKEKADKADKAEQEFKQSAMVSAINKAFDEAGVDVFGKTEELPVFPSGAKKGQYIPTSPQFKARSEVYDKAQAFLAIGKPVEEAMQDALTWYKGKYLEGDVKRSVIKDLKRNEKKLSAKRTSKETTPQYTDDEDYQKAFILKEAERLGIKLEMD